MVIVVYAKGLNRAHKLFAQLPKTLNHEIMKKSEDFMRFVQKSAKLRAPKFSGQLAESIRIKKTKKNEIKLVVESPYGWFQERGFTGKFLPKMMPVQGGYTILDWMIAKGIKSRGIRPSGRPHPFITPALEAGLTNLSNMLIDGTKKAIKRAGG